MIYTSGWKLRDSESHPPVQENRILKGFAGLRFWRKTL